ncbi:ABC-F family ATP-binding cassette domain-containing protein [Nonomuraea zeae]|uniref:ABC-F family ATP-binding cassette domain-containing protein n=1 Tax=Nonomuraea zeae TaxID=1642303 RepID=UPI0030B83225
MSLKRVSKSYGERAVLTDVSMSVGPGERVGIVGENGSGKSTLLRLLAGIERPDDGTVTVPEDAGYLGQTLEETLNLPHGRAQDRPYDHMNDRTQDGSYDRVNDQTLDRPYDRVNDRTQDRPDDRVNDQTQDRPDDRTQDLQYACSHERTPHPAHDRTHDLLHEQAHGLSHVHEQTHDLPHVHGQGHDLTHARGQSLDSPSSHERTPGPSVDPVLGHTVQQAIDAALSDLRAMERRMRELESDLTDDVMDEYGELLTAFELRGGYEADARVDKAFHGLGLAHVGRERVLSSLSGGERARLGLACVLAAAPRVLLLDEPTNHLDESALTWLEDRLREHRGAVVVVSHDRIFLDRIATAVLEVEEGSITRFGGGYTGFLTAKAAARARWEQSYATWQEELRQLREHTATTAHRVAPGRVMRDNNKMAYDRNAGRVQSSVASRVRNAYERLRRLEENPVPRPPDPLRFHGTFTSRPEDSHTTGNPREHSRAPRNRPEASRTSGNQPEESRTSGNQPGDSLSLGGRPAESHTSGDRPQESGPLGGRPEETRTSSGPSEESGPLGGRPQRSGTLRSRPDDSGTFGGRAAASRALVELRDVQVGDRLYIRSLTIGSGDRLLVRGANGAGKSTLLRTIAEHARGRVGHLLQEDTFDPDLTVPAAYGYGYPDERRAALLRTGLFKAHTLDQKVGALSVGQRRRLALARLLAGEYDLLLLDEPTNHLSPVLAEELEQALADYRGALVVVSHDRALNRRFRGNEIQLSGGRIC